MWVRANRWRIGPVLGLPASTVHRILTRHGLNRLAWMDRPTGSAIRRYERERPGELVHVDVRKLDRIPDGGGHKALGRQAGLSAAWASTASTPRSTITPASPTRKSTQSS